MYKEENLSCLRFRGKGKARVSRDFETRNKKNGGFFIFLELEAVKIAIFPRKILYTSCERVLRGWNLFP